MINPKNKNQQQEELKKEAMNESFKNVGVATDSTQQPLQDKGQQQQQERNHRHSKKKTWIDPPPVRQKAASSNQLRRRRRRRTLCHYGCMLGMAMILSIGSIIPFTYMIIPQLFYKYKQELVSNQQPPTKRRRRQRQNQTKGKRTASGHSSNSNNKYAAPLTLNQLRGGGDLLDEEEERMANLLLQMDDNGNPHHNNNKRYQQQEQSRRNLTEIRLMVQSRLDTTYARTYQLPGKSGSGDTVNVTVGQQRQAVNYALFHGLAQRTKGRHRSEWDRIQTTKCLVQNTTTTTTTNNLQLQQHQENTDDSSLLQLLPQALLIGVQKGGTTALYDYLINSRDILRSTKELYFLDEKMDDIVMMNNGVIPQKLAQLQYTQVMRKATHYNNDNDIYNNNNKLLVDWTPNYMFFSDRVPQRIQCLLGSNNNIKLFVLLRNPLERARSNYDMKIAFARGKSTNLYGHPLPTLDEYIQQDVAALQETGVIQDWSLVDFEAFWKSPAMEEAWNTYLNSGLNAPVGMGLYALQLRPYLEHAHTWNPTNFLILTSEELQTNTQATIDQVVHFLKLSPITIPSKPYWQKPSNAAKDKHRLSKATRAMLQEVYRPFNQKLQDMIVEFYHGNAKKTNNEKVLPLRPVDWT